MAKKNFSEPDLNEAIRDLGGDEDDFSLVADADFSGSDYEDSTTAANKSDKNLLSDVEKMWKELNFASEPANKKSTKKETQPEAAVKEIKSKKESKPERKDETKDKRKDEPKEAATKPQNQKDGRGGNAATAAAATADKKKFTEKKVELPKKEQPVSKKTRQAWEQYLMSLKHPRTKVLVDEQHNKIWDNSNESVSETPNLEFIESLKIKAQALLDTDNDVYFKEKQSSREFTTSLEFLKSGTFSDQLGTLSILSTDSPLHSIKFLDNLASKCEIKNRESACKALEVTKDLLVSHVLPDRRLRYFKEQPIKIGVSMETLICWSFEDYLKRYFFRILRTMEALLADTVENIRMRTLNCVFGFFQHKPEQEANLLRLALNKLGDPAGKVASRVKRLLMDVLQTHPGMKPIVATAMAELLGRAHDYRTRYYAVDTMSEFILSGRDPGLANQLVYIYLGLFERLLNETKGAKDTRSEGPVTNGKPKSGKRFRAKRGKKGGLQQTRPDAGEAEAQQHARLVAKLFTGLNRAFPFSKLDPKVFSKYTDTLYHMSHSPNVGTFIEALSFIFQLSKASTAAGVSGAGNERYYRALYDSLLDTRLPSSSKLSKFMHLLLRSMAQLKDDSDIPTSNAFSKRALQVACNISEVGAVASLVHVANLAPNSRRLIEREIKADSAAVEDEYDSKKRDPRYAKAETSHAWEVLLLKDHFHPTVALYADNMLASDSEKQALDMPDIEQYTVNSFLSKWSYKKAKAKESSRGGSIFQPLAGFTDLTLGVRQQKRGDDTPASMQDWKNKRASDIAPEERFLYEYFIQRPDRKPKDKPEAESGDAGDESDVDSIAEDEINEAMSRSGPGDLGGADLDDAELSDEDSEEDGDLEADLANAFASDDLEDDASGMENELVDDDDLSGSESEGDEDADVDDAELAHKVKDDFANFDGLDDDEDLEDKADESKDGKKRKRAWSNYPTFLDADAFEEMYEQQQKEDEPKKSSKKRR